MPTDTQSLRKSVHRLSTSLSGTSNGTAGDVDGVEWLGRFGASNDAFVKELKRGSNFKEQEKKNEKANEEFRREFREVVASLLGSAISNTAEHGNGDGREEGRAAISALIQGASNLVAGFKQLEREISDEARAVEHIPAEMGKQWGKDHEDLRRDFRAEHEHVQSEIDTMQGDKQNSEWLRTWDGVEKGVKRIVNVLPRADEETDGQSG